MQHYTTNDQRLLLTDSDAAVMLGRTPFTVLATPVRPARRSMERCRREQARPATSRPSPRYL